MKSRYGLTGSARNTPKRKSLRGLSPTGIISCSSRSSQKTYIVRQYRLPTRENKIQKVGGLYGLYLYYCYQLGYLPKHNQKQQNTARLHYLLKDDLMKMDELTKQVTLLGKHQIGTDEQLFSYKRSVEDEIKTLTADRTHLRNEIRKVDISDERLSAAKMKISAISDA